MYSGTDLSLRELLIHFTSHELQCCCRLFEVFSVLSLPPFVPFALLPVLGGLTVLVWFPCADAYGRN